MQINPASSHGDPPAADPFTPPAPKGGALFENTAPTAEVSVKQQSDAIRNNSVPTSVFSAPSAPDVAFKRDSAGQIYYVFTDPQTGKELREIPPRELRSVGEGIADYLKQEQEKSTPHVQVKA